MIKNRSETVASGEVLTRHQNHRAGETSFGATGTVLAGRVKDEATFDQPHQYASGIPHVMVNGVLVVEAGRHTGAKPGRALRRL